MSDTSTPRSITSHAAALVAARVVAAGATIATAILVPRLFDKAAFGEYSVAIGIAGILVVAADLGLTSALARYVAQGRADRSLLTKVGVIKIIAMVGVAALLAVFGFVMHSTPDLFGLSP